MYLFGTNFQYRASFEVLRNLRKTLIIIDKKKQTKINKVFRWKKKTQITIIGKKKHSKKSNDEFFRPILEVEIDI